MYSSVSDDGKNLFSAKQTLGKCPNCGADVYAGKYGAYCSGKCGMRFGKIMGKMPTEAQWKTILSGGKVLLKGLKSKKGTSYDAYFTPQRVEDYEYTDKDGVTHYGKQLAYKIDFPERKKTKNE